MPGEIRFVDANQVGIGDTRAALARNLVTGADVDHTDPPVHKLAGEGGGEIVSSRLDEYHLDLRLLLHQVQHRGVVDRDIITNGGVRAPTRSHTDDAIVWQHLRSLDDVSVDRGVDVVGDHTAGNALFAE